MTKASPARRAKKAEVAHIRKKGKITLGIDARRWFENLVLKENAIRKEAQEALRKVAAEAGEMMDELSKKEGVNLRDYEIDWKTGECALKKKGSPAKVKQSESPKDETKKE